MAQPYLRRDVFHTLLAVASALALGGCPSAPTPGPGTDAGPADLDTRSTTDVPTRDTPVVDTAAMLDVSGDDAGPTVDAPDLDAPGTDAGPASDAPVAPTDAPVAPTDAPATPTDGGPADAGPADAGPADAGPADAGPADAGPPDAGPADAGPPDAGPADAGTSTDAGREPVPALCTPNPAISDSSLATQALRILGSTAAGATTIRCNECHTLSRSRINYWRALSDTTRGTCLMDTTVPTDASATATLSCLEDPGAGEITPERLGIFATAADLEWFQYVFRHGVPGDWVTAHTAFVDRAGMPPPTASVATPLTQDEFNIVCDWFERGVPALDSIVPADPVSATCLPGVSDDVITHVDTMATTGWAARNASAGMLMFGCAGATSTRGCLAAEPYVTSMPFATNWENIPTGGVPGARLRLLVTTSYETAWWTRSSADGRFTGHGAAMNPRLRFIDLTTERVIGSTADYDPDFFPDGSGFMIQDAMSGARVCESRVLTTGTPTSLTFTEPGCSSASGVGLYQHVGASLSGGDYWAIASNAGGYVYDNGGQNPTLRDPLADYTAAASATVTFFTNDGTQFVRGANTTIRIPYEGDHVISPSLRVMLTRAAGPGGVPMGYILRRLDVTGSGASTTISAPEIGRYCIAGAKPSFSYDERWMVTHHYIIDSDAVSLGFSGPSDPGFAAYRTRGGANVYLVDLTTGASYRLTNMGPGQYALFPHFRSDGWIYITVRTEGTTPEHIIASDAALLLP